MKKTIFILCLVFLLAGCGQQAQNQQKVKDQVRTQQDNKSIFSSIKDAFDRYLALRCEYTDEDGEKTINYIKNKMIRTEGIDDGKKVYGIFRDEKFYIWEEDSDQGMVFNLANLKERDDVTMGDQVIHSTDDVINVLEKYKENCRVENVADSLFVVPKNINFIDLNNIFN